MDDEEWIVVKKNKKSRSKKTSSKIVWTANGPTYSLQNAQTDRQEFLESPSYKSNYNIINEQLLSLAKKQSQNGEINVQCLGLGNFMTSVKSRFQYYFLKDLILALLKKEFPTRKINLHVFDPIFNEKCKQEIAQIGGTSDNRNQTNLKGINIFFMPHCQRFLYEQILNCQKDGALVIGNSIEQYIERCKMIKEQVPMILEEKCGKEVKLSDFKESLNDTFVYFI